MNATPQNVISVMVRYSLVTPFIDGSAPPTENELTKALHAFRGDDICRNLMGSLETNNICIANPSKCSSIHELIVHANAA